MQGLLFFRNAGEDVADAKGNDPGDDLGEVAAGSAREGDTIAVEIGDDEAHDLFADGGLPVGTFEIRIVEPTTKNACRNQQTYGTDKSGDDGRVRMMIVVKRAQEAAKTGQKKKWNENRATDCTDQQAINEMSDQAEPEARV